MFRETAKNDESPLVQNQCSTASCKTLQHWDEGDKIKKRKPEIGNAFQRQRIN